MATTDIDAIPALSDNYIWALSNASDVVVVDPGDAKPVLRFLQTKQLNLSHILITHHHYDHIDGVDGLIERYPQVAVYGPANESISGVQFQLGEADTVELQGFGLSLQVLDVPGHTAGHIAYFGQLNAEPVLFCGDTLFAAGCGRLFDGTAEQLYASLTRLSKLPAATKVYCTHEYTLKNLQFAKMVEPQNKAIVQREHAVKQLRVASLPSLPTTIAQELDTNPFLRVDQEAVATAIEDFVGKPISNAAQSFAALRGWKDAY